MSASEAQAQPAAEDDDDAFVPNYLSINNLAPAHRDTIAKAIDRILSTDIAEITYAQILDGLPLIDTIDDTRSGAELPYDHPIQKHCELRAGVHERTGGFRESFDPGILKFDSRLLMLYQAASPGSRAFKTRLIELVALSVHQIAVILFQVQRDDPEPNDEYAAIASWVPAKDDVHDPWWRFNPEGAWPTLFAHGWYRDHKQYPHGAADMAGFWAEARILGGVVLFDRRTPESDAVYWHPDRDGVTYRICRLLDGQKKQLLDFLLADDVPGGAPAADVLPLLPDEHNDERVDPEEPIKETGIYRNSWERAPMPWYSGDDRLINPGFPDLDFPSLSEWGEANARGLERVWALRKGSNDGDSKRRGMEGRDMEL